jgi:beta-glucanase (GH16 family)
MKKLFFLSFLTCISLWGCAKDNKSDPAGVKPGSGTGSGEYELVWSDEFNYSGLPDNKKWSYDTDGNASGWGNNEAQFYTSARLKNSEVKDGNLYINALKEDFEGKKYTSARLVTRSKGDWLYGKIEVRAKLPEGRGMWPAIWMLPTDWIYGGWPASGEIDIMENVGYDPYVILATAHTQAYNHVKGTQKSGKLTVTDCYTEFHNYILEWEANEYRAYIDDKLIFTFQNEKTGFQVWPFDKRFHLLLNVAVGGNWGGAKGIDDTIFPRSIVVDYVRVYQRQ